MPKKKLFRRKLFQHIQIKRPDILTPIEAIVTGCIQVNGRVIRNPNSLVSKDISIVYVPPKVLRGEIKLQAALEKFRIIVQDKVALDAGASTGGFSKMLLFKGAKRVYAVDAGYGQLLGSLRQDPRIQNLEATNIGLLNQTLIPESIGLLTLDLSYLSIANAIGQFNRIGISKNADLIALIKPMFELQRSRAPCDEFSLEESLQKASAGVSAAGWKVISHMNSPIRGSNGAKELFLYARFQSDKTNKFANQSIIKGS